MKIIGQVISRRWRPERAAVAGLLATTAYSIAMEGDMAITRNRFSDVRFIQGLMGKQATAQKKFLLLAWILHMLNGVVLAELYAAVFKRFLPGPDWLKGAIFGELFIVAAWWLTPLADRYHPLIKNGELPKLANRRSSNPRPALVNHPSRGIQARKPLKREMANMSIESEPKVTIDCTACQRTLRFFSRKKRIKPDIHPRE